MSTQHWTVDLSHPLDARTPPFPGDPEVEITVLGSTAGQEAGGPRQVNSSRLGICLHCGTHMDAPFHFFVEGLSIDQVPLQQCVGPALLIPLPARAGSGSIDARDLHPFAAALRATGKVVLNTGWHHWWCRPDYFTDHPVLTGEAAGFMLECGVHLVGVDFPSVDQAPYPAHEVLLGGGAVILENLTNLDAIPAAQFQLTALPLKVAGRDGSPVRAIASER